MLFSPWSHTCMGDKRVPAVWLMKTRAEKEILASQRRLWSAHTQPIKHAPVCFNKKYFINNCFRCSKNNNKKIMLLNSNTFIIQIVICNYRSQSIYKWELLPYSFTDRENETGNSCVLGHITSQRCSLVIVEALHSAPAFHPPGNRAFLLNTIKMHAKWPKLWKLIAGMALAHF